MNNNIENVVEVFNRGGVVIFPTDTAIGIGCRVDDEKAVQKIYQLRRRPEQKPLLILVSSVEMAEKYMLPVSRKVSSLMEKYWPGGVTFILPASMEHVPSAVRAKGNTVAIRFPQHEELVKVIEAVGVPIVAPSANFSGEKTPLTLEEVDPLLEQQVDFVLPGVCTIKGVSTILDCANSPYAVVREGVVTIDHEDLIP